MFMEEDIDGGPVLPLHEADSPRAAGTEGCAEAEDADDDGPLPVGPRSFEELVNNTEFTLPRLVSFVAAISGTT